jgi:NUDIX domain
MAWLAVHGVAASSTLARMAKRSNVSAGLLPFRRSGGELEVFLAHPGGPFWRDRDLGAWTIPKGLLEGSEDPLVATIREFEEETAIRPEDLSCHWAASVRRPASWCTPGRGREKPIRAGPGATSYAPNDPPTRDGGSPFRRWTGASGSTHATPDKRSIRRKPN